MACKRSAVRSLTSTKERGPPSSRGLGHRPFTAITGVPNPRGDASLLRRGLQLRAEIRSRVCCGVVVQLVRIPACHAGVAGSSPVHSAKGLWF